MHRRQKELHLTRGGSSYLEGDIINYGSGGSNIFIHGHHPTSFPEYPENPEKYSSSPEYPEYPENLSNPVRNIG